MESVFDPVYVSKVVSKVMEDIQCRKGRNIRLIPKDSPESIKAGLGPTAAMRESPLDQIAVQSGGK